MAGADVVQHVVETLGMRCQWVVHCRWLEEERLVLPGRDHLGAVLLQLRPVALGQFTGDDIRLGSREIQPIRALDRVGHRHRPSGLQPDKKALPAFRLRPIVVKKE